MSSLTSHKFSSHRLGRKAGDTLDENIEQIRKIARLVNGIYVVRGLTDGSIQPDAFISELLRLGPVTLPKIKAMNLSDSKVRMDTMRGVLENLAVTPLEAKAEQRYLDFDAFRKDTKDIGDIASLTGLDDYKKELETLKALVIDWNKIEALKTAVMDFLKEGDNLLKPFDPANAYTYLDGMKPKVQALNSTSQAIGHFSASFKKIQRSDEILEPISKTAKGITESVSKRASLHREPDDVSADEAYYNKIGTIKNLKFASGDDEKNIKAVFSIFENRIQTPVTFHYTSGFINGPYDLNEIPKDLNDAKLKILISNTDSLLKAMEPLKSIGETAGALEGTFGSSIDRKKALEYVLTERKSLVEFSGNIDPLVTAMKSVHDCKFSDLPVVSTLEEVKNLLEQAEDLRKKMDDFSRIMTVSNFLLGNPSYFRFMNKALASVDENKKETFENIQKMLVDRGPFKNVYSALNSSISSFDQISQISQDPKMTDLATSIIQNYPKFDEFRKEAAEHIAFFKCLQDVKNVELIPDGIQKIRSFRQIDLKSVNESISAIEDVEEAVKEFGNLTDSIAVLPKMKNSLNPETKALEQLQNPSEHSMTIGGAARGIIAMKSAFDQKSLFDVVESHLNFVLNELENAKNLAANVDNLKKLENIPKFFNDLESWTRGINLTEPNKLKDYSVIFLKAQKVTGIEDLEKMRDSVKVLENSAQDATKKKNLNELKSALDGLSGMRFSSYKKQFADVDGTLEKLDLFFAQYSYELHPTTEYIELSTLALETTSLSSATSFHVLTTPTTLTTNAPVDFPVSGYVIIVGIVAVAVAAGSVLYCWLQKLYCFRRPVEPKSN